MMREANCEIGTRVVTLLKAGANVDRFAFLYKSIYLVIDAQHRANNRLGRCDQDQSED